MKKSFPIDLASQSPRRKFLLKEAGLRFRTIPSSYEEDNRQKLVPRLLVLLHARHKALAALRQGRISGAFKGRRILLAADTIVDLDHRTIGKPRNHREAQRTLGRLQGRWHRVWTGVVVFWMDDHRVTRRKLFAEKTDVHIRPLTPKQIRAYLRRINPLDKAGAYAIQSRLSIVDGIRGSWSNAVGLPMEKLKSILKS